MSRSKRRLTPAQKNSRDVKAKKIIEEAAKKLLTLGDGRILDHWQAQARDAFGSVYLRRIYAEIIPRRLVGRPRSGLSDFWPKLLQSIDDTRRKNAESTGKVMTTIAGIRIFVNQIPKKMTLQQKKREVEFIAKNLSAVRLKKRLQPKKKP